MSQVPLAEQPFVKTFFGALSLRNQCYADRGLVQHGLTPTRPFPKGKSCWCNMHEEKKP